jgi:2-polyprenyl-3-methyl-5-hydroxy-6-metoxy-1,4-benzoquinol methylase
MLSKSRIKSQDLVLKDYFERVYEKNSWLSEESVSGHGSSLEQTKELRKELRKVIKDFNIKSMIDIPCGDANWMKEENFFDIEYLGIDIVSEVIKSNQIKYSDNSQIKFKVGNFADDELRLEFDLVFTRDLFVHLSYSDILKCLNNFLKSTSNFLALTTFQRNELNLDLEYPSNLSEPKSWRPLNMLAHPFHFANPKSIIDEKCSERDGERIFDDKAMAIFDRKSVVQAQIYLSKYLNDRK